MALNHDIILGTPLNEAEAFTRLLESLKIAESSCKQLALLRDEPRWIAAEAALMRTRDLVTKLAQQGFSRASH